MTQRRTWLLLGSLATLGVPIAVMPGIAAAQSTVADPAAALNDRVLALMGQGAFEAAEPIARQALQAREAGLGRDHLYTMTSVHLLGIITMQLERFEEAEAFFLRARPVRERELGLENNETLATMTMLGIVYMQMGRLDEAAPLLELSLKTKERVFGPDHASTRGTRDALAELNERLAGQ